MILSLVQYKSVKGDITQNITNHLPFIQMAYSYNAELILFPELSLTGYEPSLAKELAIQIDDPRLLSFQLISDQRNIKIGVGVPTLQENGICISTLVFRPNQPVQVYSKQHLHEDEKPFFIPGPNSDGIIADSPKTALAICYELSVPEHSQQAADQGAQLYAATVAKDAVGVQHAHTTLSEISKRHVMMSCMVNATGPSDDFVSVGGSGVWNQQGELLGRLDGNREGMLLFDTNTQDILLQHR